MAQVGDAWGRIDVLFNNAGIAGVGTVEETSLEQWERVMAVNVRGVFLVARAVLPIMVAAGRGSIVNMSSTIADIGLARRASYAASKGAVMALTRQMQADYAQHGIRVNALLPGTIHTPFVDRYLADSYEDPEAGLEALRRRQLTGRPRHAGGRRGGGPLPRLERIPLRSRDGALRGRRRPRGEVSREAGPRAAWTTGRPLPQRHPWS